MWSVLLSLCQAARRPLTILDFETTGLDDPYPVEYALLVYAPWLPPEDDPVSREARGRCPPGLWCALTDRLDPGRPIPKEATGKHGIVDADVRGKPAWNDLALRAMFQAYASGNADDGEGPAVWVGHNAAEFDVALARRWGYLPDRDLDVVDTMRLHRRLAKEHPFPLAPDVVARAADGADAQVAQEFDAGLCPAIAHGLDAYASALQGTCVALFNARPQGHHGALADGCATAWCLARFLDQWGPLWPGPVASDPPEKNLRRLVDALMAPPSGQVSWDGWLRRGDDGAVTWARGKFEGRPVHRDEYVLGLPRRPDGSRGGGWRWCSVDTANLVTQARPLPATGRR